MTLHLPSVPRSLLLTPALLSASWALQSADVHVLAVTFFLSPAEASWVAPEWLPACFSWLELCLPNQHPSPPPLRCARLPSGVPDSPDFKFLQDGTLFPLHALLSVLASPSLPGVLRASGGSTDFHITNTSLHSWRWLPPLCMGQLRLFLDV